MESFEVSNYSVINPEKLDLRRYELRLNTHLNSPRQNARAYGFLTPALLVMTLTGLIPMAIVVFYSVNDTFAGNSFFFVGAAWFKQVLTSPEFFAALGRSIGFSALVLAIQIPLGIFIALRMPASGFLSSLYIVLMAIPLLTPSIVVGYLWKVLSLPDIGLVTAAAGLAGFDWNMNNSAVVWATLAVDGCMALDQPCGAAVLCRPACHSR